MAFSMTVQIQAMNRAKSRCECKRLLHFHAGNCCGGRNRLEFHHILAESKGGSNSLANCEVLCRKCHELTPSFGRS